MESSGLYEKIYVNKGISNEFPGIRPNRRPDIMAVRYDGTIDQFEIKSKSDSYEKLLNRMNSTINMFGERKGSINVLRIDKSRKW